MFLVAEKLMIYFVYISEFLLPLFQNESWCKTIQNCLQIITYTKFDLHENEHVSKTNFHMKDCAPGPVKEVKGLENDLLLCDLL